MTCFVGYEGFFRVIVLFAHPNLDSTKLIHMGLTAHVA